MTIANKKKQRVKLTTTILHFHNAQTLDLSDNHLSTLGDAGLVAITQAIARTKIAKINLGNNGYEEWYRGKLSSHMDRLLHTLANNRAHWPDTEWPEHQSTSTSRTFDSQSLTENGAMILESTGIDLRKPSSLINHPAVQATAMLLIAPLLFPLVLLETIVKLLEFVTGTPLTEPTVMLHI